MEKAQARVIQIHPKDNVAIALEEFGIKKGQRTTDGLVALEDIPQGHKIALKDLNKGENIVRYGVSIGYAKEAIEKGRWIDETMMDLPKAPALEELNIQPGKTVPLEPIEGVTFQGFMNPDGSAGTKNLLGIMTTVQCVEGVVNKAVERMERELLPHYPHVDGIMVVNHNYGCGVAIGAPEAKVPIRTLHNLSKHPNFGGTLLLVGLGCEKLQPEMLLGDQHARQVILQEETGFADMMDHLLGEAEEILKTLNQRRRTTCPVSALTIGLQCGGSDAFSGVTSNPAVGYAADLLVRAGARVLFSEVTEVRDGIHLLLERAADSEVSRRLKEEMAWYDAYLDAGKVDRDANPAPGNKKGGLANIVEKAMGSIAKSGTSPIVEVLSPGERPAKHGLIYAATPASDFVCGTLQLASGIGVQVFTTGRGTPYGLKMAPVIKVSSRSILKDKWKDLIDVDAGIIATGEATLEEVGEQLFRLILDVASGKKKTWADTWGLENALCLFNPAPIT